MKAAPAIVAVIAAVTGGCTFGTHTLPDGFSVRIAPETRPPTRP